jgi:hypothetical protein
MMATGGCSGGSRSTDGAGEPASGEVSAADVVGVWEGQLDGALRDPFVRLDADGSAALFDGCNQIGGLTWRLDAGRVVLAGEGVTTLVGCPGLRPVLERTSVLSVDRGELAVLGAGDEVARLVRADR